MRIAALRVNSPRAAVRALLIAEVAVYVAVLATYVRLALPADGPVAWYDVVFFIFAAVFPIAMNLLHGDRPADSGLRVDNIARSAGEVAVVTAVLAAGVTIVGLAVGGFHWTNWRHFASRAEVYILWGPVQQYLLQSFGLRRLRQAGAPPVVAAVAAAGMFAMVHWPNWPLVALACGAGIVWCLLFLRRANLITLGIAHAVLALLLYHAWPEGWLHRLTIGGEYLERIRIFSGG